MQVHRYLLALGLVVTSASSFAATTVYTSSASFLAALSPGAYTNTFTGLTNTPPATFASGSFSYTLASSGGLYTSGTFYGTNLPASSLTITFNTANVTAVGGNFFSTNISDAFVSAPVTLSLSDGTSVTYTPTALTDYRGFTSTASITSLTFAAPAATNYASLDNLTVGIAAVPEPTTMLLMGLGATGLLIFGRRRA